MLHLNYQQSSYDKEKDETYFNLANFLSSQDVDDKMSTKLCKSIMLGE